MREMYRYKHDFAYQGALKMRHLYGYDDSTPLPFLGIQMIPEDIEDIATNALERTTYDHASADINLTIRRIEALYSAFDNMDQFLRYDPIRPWTHLFELLSFIDWKTTLLAPQQPNAPSLLVAVVDFFSRSPEVDLTHTQVIFKVACLKIFRDHILSRASSPEEVEYCRRKLHSSDQKHLPMLARVAEARAS